MKRADRNLNHFFAEIKKVLDKTDDDHVMAPSTKTVGNARLAEADGKFVSHIFNVFAEATNDSSGQLSRRVNKVQFVKYIKSFLKSMSES